MMWICNVLAGAGALAAILFCVRGARAGVVRARVAWAGLFAATACALAVFGAVGMVEADLASRVVVTVMLVACVVVELRFETGSGTARGPQPGARPGWSRRAAGLASAVWAQPVARLLACVLVMAVLTTLALELPSNHEVWNIAPGSLALEIALVAALLLLGLLVCRLHGALACVLVIVLAGVGIGECFVATFKAMPIQPGDLFALSTAATVAGSYHYVLTPYCLYGITAAALAMLVASCVRRLVHGSGMPGVVVASPDAEKPAGAAPDAPDADADKPHVAAVSDTAHAPTHADRPLSRRAALGLAAVSVATLAAQPFIDYYDTLGIRVGSWYPLRGYYKNGFLPAFISGAQKMVPTKPRGYKRAAADALIKRYAASYAGDAKLGRASGRAKATAQFKQLKPSVVCIMNESFADLSIFDKLRCGYEGPTRFLGIKDAVLQGVSYMSAYGAGTCNSEFEFLTGHSMAFLGGGVYPYMVYNLAPTENLARQFKSQGYRTVAMHPNHGTNWNRQNVFEDMGFDAFYTIEDVFKGAPELCHKATDAATYDECLKVLRDSSVPVFIHDVTMQNHSGYDTGLIPAAQRVNLTPPGADADHAAWTDEYLALMEESDRAFQAFLDELRGLDKPVVVVMYGDHQPFFSDAYNDAFFTGEGEADHAARIWQTRYVVWANYDVAGSAQASERLDTSINNVGALALQAIGAPLSSYQKAHLVLMQKMPALSVAVRRDADGSWHLPDEASASSAAEDDFSRMQYRTLFDHGGSVFATRRQAAANETDPNAAPGKDK